MIHPHVVASAARFIAVSPADRYRSSASADCPLNDGSDTVEMPSNVDTDGTGNVAPG